MKEDTTPAPQGDTTTPGVRVGDEIIFKFEGNLHARVEASEVVDGEVWFEAQASLHFSVPLSLVVGIEKE